MHYAAMMPGCGAAKSTNRFLVLSVFLHVVTEKFNHTDTCTDIGFSSKLTGESIPILSSDVPLFVGFDFFSEVHFR
jgi:hypothetical protein